MRLICTTITLFVCIFTSAQTVSDAEIGLLDRVEKAMFAATSRGDSAAFRRIAGIDYYTINANGIAQNLDEAMAVIPRFKGSFVRLSEQKTRIFGTVVLRTGRAKFFVEGKLVAEVLYTTGWVHRESRWQFIHWQGTPSGISLSEAPGR